MSDGSIVNRENLNNALVSKHSPINHLFQIAEVSYSKALLATQ